MMKLHHIGVVVNRIQDSVGELKNYLAFQNISLPTPVGSQKVNVCFLKIGEPFLELIEPTSTDSPINDFVKKGGGIHHLCFEVDDIHKELGSLAKKGATILVNPVKGFDERLIAFADLNMKNTRCGLIELLETKGKSM
ncbi:MAG: methylmalonyl-CoA epimerase [Thaumarchaeota archaeon 13_1_40CM_4_38_7]|nr:MAG: methylmalonyl-CoA epimerase [Thaumarchaeota archaeon 13_1_40CM_4_38_7]